MFVYVSRTWLDHYIVKYLKWYTEILSYFLLLKFHLLILGENLIQGLTSQLKVRP
jgi:hypothetical protein